MVALMSLISLLRTILFILTAFLLCFNNFYVYYVITILIFSIVFLSFLIFPFSRTWQGGESATWSLLLSNVLIIVLLIVCYAVIFYKIELFQVGDKIRSISPLESVYLSIVSLAGLNSYISTVNPKVAILIALEGVSGYFYLAFLFAILSYWFTDAIEKNNKYLSGLKRLKLFRDKNGALSLSSKKRNIFPSITLLEGVTFGEKGVISTNQRNNFVAEIKYSKEDKVSITADKFNKICVIDKIDVSSEKKIKEFIDNSFRSLWNYYFEGTNFQ